MLIKSEDAPFAGLAFEEPLPDQSEERAQTSERDDQPLVMACCTDGFDIM